MPNEGVVRLNLGETISFEVFIDGALNVFAMNCDFFAAWPRPNATGDTFVTEDRLGVRSSWGAKTAGARHTWVAGSTEFESPGQAYATHSSP